MMLKTLRCGSALLRAVVNGIIISALFGGTANAQSQLREVFRDDDGLVVSEGTECQHFDGESKPLWGPVTWALGGRGFPDRHGPVTLDVETIAQVEHSWVVPRFVTDAVVYLNGFDYRYGNKDHHVQHITAAVGPVTVDPATGTVNWLSKMELSDEGRDDEIDVCIHYVGLAWNRDVYDITAQRLDDKIDTSTKVINNWPARDFGANAGYLPTGFAYSLKERKTDNHLLQLGYALNRPEGASSVNTVETVGVMKDNSSTTIHFASNVTALAGDSIVGFPDQETSFDFEPHGPTCKGGIFQSCIDPIPRDSSSAERMNFLLGDGDLQMVLPVLSGFELDFARNDEHIKRVGAWIHDIRVEADRVSFNVSTVLTDKGGENSFRRRRVSFIGVKKVAGPFSGDGPVLGQEFPGDIPSDSTCADIESCD